MVPCLTSLEDGASTFFRIGWLVISMSSNFHLVFKRRPNRSRWLSRNIGGDCFWHLSWLINIYVIKGQCNTWSGVSKRPLFHESDTFPRESPIFMNKHTIKSNKKKPKTRDHIIVVIHETSQRVLYVILFLEWEASERYKYKWLTLPSPRTASSALSTAALLWLCVPYPAESLVVPSPEPINKELTYILFEWNLQSPFRKSAVLFAKSSKETISRLKKM